MASKEPVRPKPDFAVAAKGREMPEQINLQLQNAPAEVRQAAMSVFSAANDHSNGPAEVTVFTGPGTLTITATIGEYVHGA